MRIIHHIWYRLTLLAHAESDPFRIYGKTLRILILVFQATDSDDLVILVCTVFH